MHCRSGDVAVQLRKPPLFGAGGRNILTRLFSIAGSSGRHRNSRKSLKMLSCPNLFRKSARSSRHTHVFDGANRSGRVAGSRRVESRGRRQADVRRPRTVENPVVMEYVRGSEGGEPGMKRCAHSLAPRHPCINTVVDPPEGSAWLSLTRPRFFE